MKKYFVWTRDIERMINDIVSDKSKHPASNSDAMVKLLGRAAAASEHYLSFTATRYELSRNWKNINKSSTHRMLERNQRLWEGVGLLFSALELQKVLAAPPGSIIIPTFSIGGYSFEITKPTDPNYLEAYSRLPAAAEQVVTGCQPPTHRVPFVRAVGDEMYRITAIWRAACSTPRRWG